MKLLIIRFSSIGDIILTSPVARIAKNQINAEVHFITKEQYASLLKSNPYIDKVYTIKSDVREIINDLKKEKYDYIIDLHNSLRSKILKFLLKTKSFSFKKENIKKWLMVNFKVKSEILHITERYINTLEKFKVKNDNEGLDFFYQDNPNLFKTFDIPESYVCISLGAKHFTKKIPIEIIKKIISNLNYNFVLIGGYDVTATANAITKDNPDNIIDLTGKISIYESAQIIDNSLFLISSDTGMMHIGAALKKEMIVLWGNTVPGFGMHPNYGNKKIMYFNSEVNNLSCRPCSKIGFDNCPKKHFKCMKNQNIDNIVNFSQKIIKHNIISGN